MRVCRGYYKCVYSVAVKYGEWFTVCFFVYMYKSAVTQLVYFQLPSLMFTTAIHTPYFTWSLTDGVKGSVLRKVKCVYKRWKWEGPNSYSISKNTTCIINKGIMSHFSIRFFRFYQKHFNGLTHSVRGKFAFPLGDQ